jgi:hypothetical protein
MEISSRFGITGREQRPLPRSYRNTSILLLLWGLAYLFLIAEALFIMRPDDFVRLVNVGMILPGYSDYVQHLPTWIVGLTLLKGFSRVLGSVGLLLRTRWAVTMYALSLAMSCVIFFRGFLVDNRGAFEVPTQIGLDVAFFCLSIYALYFAMTAFFRGILR